ncbi:hypothetical protein Terro_3928 [Terriglobus roseus DSM 18391]|uniref:Putative zinc-finger domain-containing protein n=1 Tax=Terriglobus roseus (strain DSM 18391 / NRRL B-41598 / KBS 63) TaxID=926566 RepID=I3ZLL8_TERRK|nr:HEAT repeat domain-containing protein [Terriglobus roseus]AFL90136.1 hypothetical protein Terro_3928 [Terriglobus roseus DSM 18391]
MNCEEVREQLVLLAYDELREAERADLELHLRGCAGCQEESEALNAMTNVLAQESVPVVTPNMLAASRMRLDEALDEAGKSTWSMRLRAALQGTWQHLYAAPALATLLVGVGFLGGNMLTRYQVAHAPQPHGGLVATEGEGIIGNISGIVTTPDPDVIQVKYTQMVPMMFQGRLDEPQLRRLLTLAAQHNSDNGIRAISVDLLAKECKAGHVCEHGEGDATGFRDALLVSLRYDKSPAVRLRALEGLGPYIAQDQKVRDVVLESLMRDSSADVRTHAIGMLEPVEGDSSVRQVLHTVSTQDENPYIRTASMQALGTVDGIQ